jgi:branched-chain amino acid transport system substrate-binding protein
MSRRRAITLRAAELTAIAGAMAVIVGASEPIPSTPPPRVVNVGAILPITGELAEFGEAERTALEVARADIDAAAAARGIRLELQVRDSGGDPQKAVAGFTELARSGTAFFFVESSGASLAIAPLAAARRALTMNVAATPRLTAAGAYSFRDFPAAELEAKTIVGHATGALAARTFALLYVDNEYGRGYATPFAAEVAAVGARLVATRPYSPQGDQLEPALHQVAALTPDALFLVGFGRTLGHAVARVRELGFRGHLFAAASIAYPQALAAAGSSAEGVLYADIAFDADARGATHQFAAAYRARCGKAPSSLAAMSYDGFRLMAEAILATAADPTRARAWLLARPADYAGLSGRLRIDAARNVVYPLVIKAIHTAGAPSSSS